jgi:hypothetical protein
MPACGSPLVVLPQVSVERTFLGHRLTDANDPGCVKTSAVV